MEERGVVSVTPSKPKKKESTIWVPYQNGGNANLDSYSCQKENEASRGKGRTISKQRGVPAALHR